MAMGTDPIADLLALQRDVDRVMERFGARVHRAEEEERRFWMPTVDVLKQGDDMIVRAEVPGVSPNDISVAVTGNMLTIKGERRREQQRQEGDYILQEARYGSFERRITLPQDVDASQVRAQYRAGILEITVPRTALFSPESQTVAVTGAQAPAMGAQGTQQPQGATEGYQPGYMQSQASYEQRETAGMAEQPQTQPYGTTYAGQQTQTPQGVQQPRQEAPAVQTEGGWVQPQGQPTEPKPAEEEKPRSALGSWLHGGRE